MTWEENIFLLVIFALAFVFALCHFCYSLGKDEGREEAKEEYSRKLRARGLELRIRSGRKPHIR